MENELNDLLVEVFSKKDRDSHIKLNNHLSKEIDNINEEIKKNTLIKDKIYKSYLSINHFLIFIILFDIATILYYISTIVFMYSKNMNTYINSNVYSVISLSVLFGLLAVNIIFFLYKFNKYNNYIKTDNKIKLLQEKFTRFSIFQTFICGQIDLLMYKDIYQKIYDIQEYLKNNDDNGYKAFVNAATSLNIDLSKYVKK